MKNTFFKTVAFLVIMVLAKTVTGQETFHPNGVYDEREGLYAFTNATIYTHFDKKLDNATLLIRDGKIEAVGTNVSIPQNAVTIDLAGKYIYPSFVDSYTDYGLPEVTNAGPRGRRSLQLEPDRKGAYGWNDALSPDFHAHKAFVVNAKNAKAMRDLGFGTVASHRMDGISRGTSTVVLLGEDKENELILKERAANHLSLNKGSSTQTYPASIMGAVALLRQTYYDAQWYQKQNEQVNLSLAAWNENLELPQIFEVRDKLEALRAAKIGKEFGVQYILKGNGDEYQLIDEIKGLGATLIVPLNFPDAYDVEDPYEALRVSLANLKHWELAPANPARLAAANIAFALTTSNLEKKDQFPAMLRKAIEYGLSAEQALKALTQTPADLLGVSDKVGSLEQGKTANFLITSGDLFSEKTKLYHNWVGGKRFVINELDAPDWPGEYVLTVGTDTYPLTITGEADKPEMKMGSDSSAAKVDYQFSNNVLTLTFEPKKGAGKLRLTGMADGRNWKGNGQNTEGKWVAWKAEYKGPAGEEKKKSTDREKKDQDLELGKVTYPFAAFGRESLPAQGAYLIRNATVWTNEADGILQNADVLVRAGKIARIGKNLAAGDATMIDGTGKHLTPGIIDEHSHIAGSGGINEGSQVSSAEVRIGDILNSEDINIYRQLSGGVTTSQILHGSANPIGGQSALIKLRWGYTPEKLKVENADGFIKFALGENVKQSNWPNDARVRFPQTRMGVEQVYADHFARAQEYGKLKKSGKLFRKDLEMETLLEIMEGKRYITCHSYQQGEINMMMKIAEQFDFRVNTFTHILEGYKVADKMAEHGVGASTFSDWWAYKFEVVEAIPYNAAIMHEEGVTVAINSDDAEMARRLNQEAAKAVLFGKVSEEDALKFVTLNPAKLLHIDDRTGSIKAGKDADLVLWSDHPLSVYAKAEKTLVDGIVFFDREEDQKMSEMVAAERNRIIQKMLAVKKKGGKTQRPQSGDSYRVEHCEDYGHGR